MSPRPRKAPVSRRGFTLIEMLIVVTLVGIMVAIAAPRFRVSELTEVQLAGAQLAQDADFVRTRALATRSLARLKFKTGTTQSYVAYLDTNADSTVTETNAEQLNMRGFGERPLPVRVQYGRGSAPAIPGDAGSGAVTFASSYAEFNSRGIVQPMGTSGVVYFKHATKPTAVVAVEISASGNVRLWTYNNGAWK